MKRRFRVRDLALILDEDEGRRVDEEGVEDDRLHLRHRPVPMIAHHDGLQQPAVSLIIELVMPYCCEYGPFQSP